MENKNGLIISICIFIIVGMLAFLLILNKGHIGTKNLVNTSISEEKNEEKIMPNLEISTEKEYLSLKNKEEIVINATIDGENVTTGIEYKSSDEDIIKIQDGKAVAISEGKATITAMYEGVQDTIDLYVITPIESISFTSTSSSIRVGKDLQMKLKVTPSDASIDTLKYSSSDENIANVNANGIVTGVSKGRVVITVKDTYTGIEKKVNLTIK